MANDAPSIRDFLPDDQPTLFALLSAGRDLLAHDTVMKLFDTIRALRWTQADNDLLPMQHPHLEREMTHDEVWNKAIDEVLLALDEELGRLSGSRF